MRLSKKFPVDLNESYAAKYAVREFLRFGDAEIF